jgi:hypothetical protein
MSNGNNRPAEFIVKAAATGPASSAEWKVELTIGVAMGKLGVAYSEHILGNSAKLRELGEESGQGSVDPH